LRERKKAVSQGLKSLPKWNAGPAVRRRRRRRKLKIKAL
jgi:hypothetical protein